MLTLAEFLINAEHEYNGHKQTEISGLSVKKGLKLCRELQKLTDDKYSFTMELWVDGSYTIHQMDYWNKGEHILGDTNRMILSVST
jgi:hypothetical protein